MSQLELLDVGGNKITEIPIALIHFLKNLCQLTLTNNDINRLPNLIGMHKNIKNIQVDGNPLKSIRRAIIDRGSQGVLKYLMDKYVEGQDNKVEQWAIDQDQNDILELQKYKEQKEKEAKDKEEEEKKQIIEKIKE